MTGIWDPLTMMELHEWSLTLFDAYRKLREEEEACPISYLYLMALRSDFEPEDVLHRSITSSYSLAGAVNELMAEERQLRTHLLSFYARRANGDHVHNRRRLTWKPDLEKRSIFWISISKGLMSLVCTYGCLSAFPGAPYSGWLANSAFLPGSRGRNCLFEEQARPILRKGRTYWGWTEDPLFASLLALSWKRHP